MPTLETTNEQAEINFESKHGKFLKEILAFYIPLLLRLPQLRTDKEFMEATVKAVGDSGVGDVVTKADKWMQGEIKNAIQKLHPNWQFWGEEGEDRNYKLDDSKDYLIINDPIEGTNNFRYRREEQWGSVIAIIKMATQIPVIGIIAQPMAQKIFVGIKNEGALTLTYDHSGDITKIEKMNNIPEKNYFTYNNSPHFEDNLIQQVQKFFALGSIALDKPDIDEIDKSRKTVTVDKVDQRSEIFIDPECGNLEPIIYRGVIMFKINIEIAAAIVIAEELGQIATDVNGNPWSMKICNAIFGRSKEDWNYLKRVYNQTL